MNKDYLQLEFDNLGSEANYKLADPTLVDYYKRLNNREILINQDIDDGIVEWTQEIVEWNREDKDIAIAERKPIKIWIAFIAAKSPMSCNRTVVLATSPSV